MPYTKEQAKEKLRQLIEKFKREMDSGKLKTFNEEQTKKDYIEPFFEYLNWDVRNSDEVTVEEKVSKGRVDYGFRIDGITKFYVEAKAFKEDLNNIVFSEQAINYAWLKSVTWTILTNFEGLKVFNAEWESRNPRDKIYIDLKWNEFLDKFERVWLLSKDNFLKNELDREAEEYGKKIKTTPVTPVMKQIFNDLMTWREKLTKNISSYSSNNKIAKNEEELDEYVQRIIDRLIFIRVCEDREIEKPILLSKLREWQNSHKRDLVEILNEIFRDFDEGYNSKLFASHPSEKLKIDDVILVDIIKNLYESSDKIFKYDFSAIEVDVLGNIYEEYLGYILKKTKKKIGIAENHLHRKEMGIYYTPTFVVDYIVRNTLGETLKQMKPEGVDNIKVLDMACGSGSFLLKAFNLLNSYHKGKNELDFLRKKRILTTNIYGVDLDPKAIEIAQLNLLIKAIVGEKRGLLPKLQENLKVGNSLIADQKISDRAFNWDSEFKEIIKNGGFNVIIGNPPYIRNTELSQKDKQFYETKYTTAFEQYDIYILFFERALELLKQSGYLGFITSNKFLASNYGKILRKKFLDNFKIISFVDLSTLPVFKDASTYPVITILQKEKDEKLRNSNLVKFYKIRQISELGTINPSNIIQQNYFYKIEDFKFLEEVGGVKFKTIEKIDSKSLKIADFFICQRGIPKNKIKISDSGEKALISRDLDRYTINYSGTKISFNNKKLEKVFNKLKILLPRTVLRLKAVLDKDNYFVMDRIYYLIPKNQNVNLNFILAFLNSKLIDFYYKFKFGSTHVGGNYLDLRGVQILELPVFRIVNKKEKDMEKEISELVDRILGLNKELQKFNPQSDKGIELKEEINRIDKDIDQKVYELYDLSEDEIKIIEGS